MTDESGALECRWCRADAGEPLFDDSHLLEANEAVSTEEKLERLAEMICEAGDQPETRATALLVLMSTLENSTTRKYFRMW